MLWLGSGVIGGIGLGLGYISPVSTLIKWFPDRRGMATGMAIMGFGGGAMIGAPLADRLMKFYATPASVGVWETFLTLAAIYFAFMMAGALSYRVPPDGWRPAKWDPSQVRAKKLVTDKHVLLSVAWRTPQFWLLWGVLTLNVSAGIGILGMASPLLQEVFGGRLIVTYAGFFLLGIALYSSIPRTAATVNLALFVAFFCVALSMYGGGFATVPAYLADLFGTRMVGAIHGRLLTAWSTAGVLGPVLVNYIRDYQIDHGVARAQAYSLTMFILAGLLAVGFICNLLIKPVDPKNFMTPEQIAAADAQEKARNGTQAASAPGAGDAQATWLVFAAWLAVWIPLGWGIWVTLQKAVLLFK